MGLLQILTTALQQYRQGIVSAIQQDKVYDIMLYINAINSVLPKPTRCELPKPPGRDSEEGKASKLQRHNHALHNTNHCPQE